MLEICLKHYQTHATNLPCKPGGNPLQDSLVQAVDKKRREEVAVRGPVSIGSVGSAVSPSGTVSVLQYSAQIGVSTVRSCTQEALYCNADMQEWWCSAQEQNPKSSSLDNAA